MGDFIKLFNIPANLKSWLSIALFALIYFLLGVLGLQIESMQLGVSPFLPASGFTIAAFVIVGFWLWPGVFLGLLLLLLYIDISVSMAVFSGFISIVESVVAITVARRFQFNGRLDSFNDTLIFATIVVVAPIFTASIGTFSMFLLLDNLSISPLNLMSNWWLGNSLGILLMGGSILSFNASYHKANYVYRLNEKVAVFLATVFVFLIAFTQDSALDAALMVNFLIPIIFLAALRFGVCGSVSSGLIFVVLISLFSPLSMHHSNASLYFDYQYLMIVKIWFISISSMLIASAYKDMSAQVRFEWLALHDSLTGLSNRRAMEEKIEFALKGVRSSDSHVCLLFLDVDHFKPVNDELGHIKGDEILNQVAQVLSTSVRAIDVVSRWGGDEFIVLLRQCTEIKAQEISKNILEGIKLLSFEEENKTYPISMSIGIALSLKDEPVMSYIKRVDAACYQAKKNGRNQYVMG